MIWILISLAAILCIAALARSSWEKKHFEINEYTIHAPCFDRDHPVRAVVLADLHNQVYGDGNERLLRAIDDISPEAVFIAGDFPVAIPGKSTEPAAALIEALAEKYPIYYGMGNHEYRMRIDPERYGNVYQDYDSRLKSCGVEMLHNERRRIRLGDAEADVYGLEMDRRYYKRFRHTKMEDAYLRQTLPAPREGVFRILLAHSPDYFDAYAAWGADLTLSGHLHGGVVRLAGRGLISANRGFFPRYSGGMYEKGSHKMIVSRGLGAHTIPVRLFNRPELIVLTFTE